MKKFLIVLILLSFSKIPGNDKDSTAFYEWEPNLLLGLNISQLALSNWQADGENNISYVLNNNFQLNYETPKWSFSNNFGFDFGRSKVGDLSFRTTHNDIYLENQLSYKLNWVVNPYISNTFRTYIIKIYNYKVDPTKSIVDFLDPAYITQSFGFTYEKVTNLKTRLGLAVQEIFTENHNSYSDDSLTTEVEKFKLETGIETVTKYEIELHKNIKYKTKLRLFTRFNRLDIWDVRFKNSLTANVNSYLQISLDVFIFYEKSQSLKTQYWEALKIGFTYKIF